jgi:hypothetical protein
MSCGLARGGGSDFVDPDVVRSIFFLFVGSQVSGKFAEALHTELVEDDENTRDYGGTDKSHEWDDLDKINTER